MTDIDLEAIKARADGLEAAMDNDAANYDPDLWEMCVNVQELVKEVERLRLGLTIANNMLGKSAPEPIHPLAEAAMKWFIPRMKWVIARLFRSVGRKGDTK